MPKWELKSSDMILEDVVVLDVREAGREAEDTGWDADYWTLG